MTSTGDAPRGHRPRGCTAAEVSMWRGGVPMASSVSRGRLAPVRPYLNQCPAVRQARVADSAASTHNPGRLRRPESTGTGRPACTISKPRRRSRTRPQRSASPLRRTREGTNIERIRRGRRGRSSGPEDFLGVALSRAGRRGRTRRRAGRHPRERRPRRIRHGLARVADAAADEQPRPAERATSRRAARSSSATRTGSTASRSTRVTFELDPERSSSPTRTSTSRSSP